MIRKGTFKDTLNRYVMPSVHSAPDLFCRGAVHGQEVHMLSYNNVGWTDQNLAGVSPNSGSPPISRRRTTNNTSSIWGISLDPCAPTLLQRQRLGGRRPYC